MEDDTSKWKYILCSWTVRVSIVKMSTLPEVVYIFNATPTKILMAFFTKIGRQS